MSFQALSVLLPKKRVHNFTNVMAFREIIFISIHIKITRNAFLIDHKITSEVALTGLSALQKRTELGGEYVGDRTGWQRREIGMNMIKI